MSSIPILFGYIQKLQHNSLTNYPTSILADFKNIYAQSQSANIVLIIILSIIIWCCLGWVFDTIKSDIKNKEKSSGLDPEEFDYLASEEAIPAKFNLAEAYIKMNDFKSANKVLAEILLQGSSEQKKQAMSILDGIS